MATVAVVSVPVMWPPLVVHVYVAFFFKSRLAAVAVTVIGSPGKMFAG